MRSRWNLPIYVAYVAACLLVAGAIVRAIGVDLPWSHPFTLTATFRNGDGILANNEVYLNGVKVGKVDAVDAVGGHALVTMVIEDPAGLPLYQDAKADVRKKNLLGETYIDLHRGDPGRPVLGSDGVPAQIPLGQTLSPVDIDQVLAILDPQTRDRMKLLINGAGDALTNQGGNLNDQAGSLRQLTEELNGPAQELRSRQGQIDTIVEELQRLYDVLAAQRDQVRDEFATWTDVMGQLADQEQAIGGTLQQADTLLQGTDTLLAGQVPALRALFDRLPVTLRSTQGWLTQSNAILNGIAPSRRPIHDVFSDLNTTFIDQDPNGPLDPLLGPNQHQHVWSIYSVQCHSSCSDAHESGSPSAPAASPGAPNATWAAAMGTG